MTTPNFIDFPSEVTGAILSGSNGIKIGVLVGSPNKITASLTDPLIISNGKVGIGLTPTSNLLEVLGRATFNNNNNNIALSVNSDNNGANPALNSSCTNGIASQFYAEGASSTGSYIYSEGMGLHVYSDGTSIYASNNVGIGVENPSEKLQVVGNAKIDGNITANKLLSFSTSNIKLQDTSGSIVGAYLSAEPAGGVLNSSNIYLRPYGSGSSVYEYNASYGGLFAGHFWKGSTGNVLMWLLDGGLATPPLTVSNSGSSIPQESWITVGTSVGYTAGWTDYGTGLKNVQFMKDSMGFVHLRGTCKRTSGVATTIFTLPVGYRLSGDNETFYILGDTGKYAQIDIKTDGTVVFVTGFDLAVSLSGITFDTRA